MSGKHRILAWAPAVGLMVLIFYVSSRPAPEIIRRQYVPLQDKWLHFTAYFVLAGLFLRALIWEGWEWTPRTFLVAVVLSFLYGLSDEYHQTFVPERTADLADAAADLVGAMMLPFFRSVFRNLFEWEKERLRHYIPPNPTGA